MANKPITLAVGANPTPGATPKGFIVVGGIPVPIADVVTALKTLGGYNAGVTQTLTHNTSGTLVWA